MCRKNEELKIINVLGETRLLLDIIKSAAIVIGDNTSKLNFNKNIVKIIAYSEILKTAMNTLEKSNKSDNMLNFIISDIKNELLYESDTILKIEGENDVIII